MDKIIESYQAVDIRSLLFDDQLKLYVYNQYSDDPTLTTFFQYLDTRLKEIYNYATAWHILKTNQNIFYKNYLPQEYFTYIQYLYRGIYQAFGSPSAVYRWDNTLEKTQWDQEGVKWDEINSTGILDVNKLKALLRFIMDLQCKTFTIQSFLNLCNGFLYNEDAFCYINDDSFLSPDHIVVFCTSENSSVVDLQNVLNQYAFFMPNYQIDFGIKPYPVD